MKFTEAWANIAKQNMSLKLALFVVSGCALFLGFSTVRLALKDPVVIERGCFSKQLLGSEVTPNEMEIKTFSKLALEQRFNSNDQVIEGYLSLEERKNKEKEQLNLSKKDISQFILIRSIHIDKSIITVEADRLYSVQKVRSSLPILLKITLETKTRSQTNPYGLILVKTEEVKKEEEKIDKG